MAITTKTFSYVEREDDDLLSFKIEEGKYTGVIYKYGMVKFIEQENDTGKLSFTFRVEKNPTNINLDKNVEFLNFIGDILQFVLTEENNDNK